MNSEEKKVKKYAVLVDKILAKFNISNSKDREELQQEGFLGLLKAIRTYKKGRKVPFEMYAMTCIRNAMISYLRKKQLKTVSVEEFSAETLTTSMPSPEDIAASFEIARAISKFCIKSLTPMERKALFYSLRGYSRKQITSLIGANEDAVKNALHRARSKLRKFLGSSEANLVPFIVIYGIKEVK